MDAISNGFLDSWPSTTAICVRFGFVFLYLICNSSIEAFKHFLLECPPSGIEWCFSPWTIRFYLPNPLPLVDWAKLMLFLTSPLGCIFEDERHFLTSCCSRPLGDRVHCPYVCYEPGLVIAVDRDSLTVLHCCVWLACFIFFLFCLFSMFCLPCICWSSWGEGLLCTFCWPSPFLIKFGFTTSINGNSMYTT